MNGAMSLKAKIRNIAKEKRLPAQVHTAELYVRALYVSFVSFGI